MNSSYKQFMFPTFDLQYPQVIPALETQEKMLQTLLYAQMHQNLFFANLLRQQEAFEIAKAEENMKKMLTLPTPFIEASNLLTYMQPKILEPLALPKTLSTPQKSEIPMSTPSFTKKDVRTLVNFLLDNIGTSDEKTISKAKDHYSKDPLFASLFDCLIAKYKKTTKTKEEMTKYTFRKAIRWMRVKITKGKESDPRESTKIFIQRYFGDILKEKISDVSLDDDAIIDKFLPFKKDSRMKTMNTSFVAELFESKEFASDYQEFLANFHSMMVADNCQKIEKFIRFIEDCYESKCFIKVKTYKRIPWLTCWINSTMSQAKDIQKLSRKGSSKKMNAFKVEVNSSETSEAKFEKKVKTEFIEENESSDSTIHERVTAIKAD